METTIEINKNDEINMLRIKIEVIEKELQLALNRAEKAENDLEHMKNTYKNCDCIGKSSSTSSTQVLNVLPPPIPPPMPNFKLNPVNLKQFGSLKDGITAFSLNNQRQNDDNISVTSINADVDKKPATGRYSNAFILCMRIISHSLCVFCVAFEYKLD